MTSVSREGPSYKLRYSTAHVMAQAATEMLPEAKLGWGPPHERFENGFYHDFDLPRTSVHYFNTEDEVERFSETPGEMLNL